MERKYLKHKNSFHSNGNYRDGELKSEREFETKDQGRP